MINIDENSTSRYKNREMICSICKKNKIPINSTEIKEKKLNKIISKFDKNNLDSSILIKKCNCHNNEKVHKFCLLLNIIFSFELKCNECKASYNIDISKNINKHKKICYLISFIFLLFFHLILYAASIFLILFVLLINKNIKNNFEENKLYHIYYYFGGILFIINTVLIIITFSFFLDKNNKDTYDYFLDVKDINEQNKIDKNSDQFYSLLYKYYRCFFNSQIRYLIGKKQEHMYISKGYGYYNKDLKEYIKKNNEEIKLKKEEKNKEEIKYNNGGEDILSLNLKKDKKVLNETQKNNIVNKRNNTIEESNGINTNRIENNIKEVKQKKEEEEKNDNKNKDKEKDKEKDFSEKKVNNDNYKVNENKENSIKEEFEEKIDNQNNSKNEIKVDVNLKDEKNMKENKENEENKRMSVITFNKLSIISNKVIGNFAKTALYKKIIKKNNDTIGKSSTLIFNGNKRKRRKSKKEKREKKEFKKIEEVSEKKYIDSTLLIRAEKMDNKEENNNENKMEKIEKKPSDFKESCYNNEK